MRQLVINIQQSILDQVNLKTNLIRKLLSMKRMGLGGGFVYVESRVKKCVVPLAVRPQSNFA